MNFPQLALASPADDGDLCSGVVGPRVAREVSGRRAAFREKLGRDFRPYMILGACNPPLAFDAITADPWVGLLLPCNVTVEWKSDGRTGVRLTDPEAPLSNVVLQGGPELTSVARDARTRMLRVADSLLAL